ncbi:hypothetical protein TruAng_004801 [Truncatella angustata]|nr:hypothetical protein TruAng_004801 [Truncatella angustata]
MHHGAGSSGLSFAVVGSEIRKRLPTAGILSHDARGHGETTAPGGELDLSLTTLSNDLLAVIIKTKAEMKWQELPSIILVGHSLGGAVVTELAKSGELGNSLLGYAVLDVVEGSAIDALQSMQTYLSTRPTGSQCGVGPHKCASTVNAFNQRRRSEAMEMENGSRKHTAVLGELVHRLDTELTIGQMQGKYNLQVFPEAGHFIHEDLPEKTAISLVDFHKRNDRSALVLPPKVSDLLKQGKRV